MTFTAGALADITLSQRMFRIKNVLSMCSAPLECLISTLYWGLRAVDPTLVVPAELELDFLPGTDPDSYLHVILRPFDSNPSVSDDNNYLVTITDISTDVGFHMIPSALLVLDILFLSPPWTITPIPAIGLSAAIAFAYWFWIELCYQNNGWYDSLRLLPPSRSTTKVILHRYPYPLFTMLDTTQRIGLFSVSALLMAVVTAVLKWLYGLVNGKAAMRTGLGSVKGA
jgi:hypothetical protein